jgi:hypothetical protein
MTFKAMLHKIFRHRYPVVTSRDVADESRAELDRKIQQAQASSERVVRRTREEMARSEKIIALAEQAVKSLRRVERQH